MKNELKEFLEATRQYHRSNLNKEDLHEFDKQQSVLFGKWDNLSNDRESESAIVPGYEKYYEQGLVAGYRQAMIEDK